MFILLGGLFVHPLEGAFGWRRGDIALSSAILFGMGLMAPLIGAAADRIGVRVFVAVGALGFAGAYVVLSCLSGDIRLYFAVLAFVGLIAGPATSPLIYSRVVVAHFEQNRGFALSICLSGSTALAAFMLPLTQYVISAYGWRTGYLMLACVALSIGALAFALLASAAGASEPKAPKPPAWPQMMRALRDARFWLLALCFASGGAALFGVGAHTQPFLTESHFSPERAAWVGAFLGVVTIISRLAVGVLLDRVEPGWVGLVAFLAPVGGCLILAGSLSSALAIVLALSLIACAQSAEGDFLGFFAARYFGVAHFGAISGALSFIFGVFVSLGAIVAGYMHDAFGDYRAFFYLAAGLSVIAAFSLFVSARLKA
jgi:predicted MFS family arabinose efflux permease